MLRAEHPNNVKWVNCSNNDEAYFQAVQAMWNEKETFVIVEQDIVPYPGAIKDIYDCEHDFCITWAPHWQSINGDGPWTYAHGLVKYKRRFIASYPDWFNNYPASRHWSQFDWGLVKQFQSIIHYHWPPVIHLSPIRFDSVNLVLSKRI
jgi:hypothetical protein